MAGVSFLITNALLVEGGSRLEKAEILVSNESIAGVGEPGTFGSLKDVEIVDARNHLVLPGLIDPHVHFRDSGIPNAGQKAKEDFSTGSKAAIAGGTTTVLDMPNTVPPTTTLEAYRTKSANAAKTSFCDFGLYAGAANGNLGGLEAMTHAGAIAVKLFMGSSTGSLLTDQAETQEKIFASSKENGFLLAIHAEDEQCIKFNASFYNDRKVSSHNDVRPPECAEKATAKAIELAKKHKNRTYICHVSTAKEMKAIAAAKKEGVPIFMEATPHHLFLNLDDEAELGTLVKVNPPLRTRADNRALWEALNNGTVDTIGTDHAPHTLEEKRKPYWEAPSGFPGVELRIPLMLTAALGEKTTFETVRRVCCENPAKIFGLRRKGFIAEGFDADLVFVDLEKERVVDDASQFTRCGWSPYAGKRLRGWPSIVYLRGKQVFKYGTFEGPFGRETGGMQATSR